MLNPEEFPTVFKNKLPTYGFRVGAGWHTLLREAFGIIETFLREHPEHQEFFRIVEVKSKFGALRIYTSTKAPKEIAQALAQAEELSMRTCETCGDVASENTSSAYYVSCFEHGPKTLIEPQ